jgi:hypothetical protein
MKAWIDVKEKMPELDVPVLVYLKPFDDISFAWREKSQSTFYKEAWVTMGGIMYNDDFISHWMELPGKPETHEEDPVS